MDSSNPFCPSELVGNFGHIVEEAVDAGEKFRRRAKLAEKEKKRGAAEFISHISGARRRRGSVSTNLKMAPNFFPSARLSRFHSPIQSLVASACSISKCATFFPPPPPSSSPLLDLPPEGFHSVLFHLHFCLASAPSLRPDEISQGAAARFFRQGFTETSAVGTPLGVGD